MKNEKVIFLEVIDILLAAGEYQNTSYIVAELLSRGIEIDEEQVAAVLTEMIRMGYLRLQFGNEPANESMPEITDKGLSLRNLVEKERTVQIITQNNNFYAPVDGMISFGDKGEQIYGLQISEEPYEVIVARLAPLVAGMIRDKDKFDISASNYAIGGHTSQFATITVTRISEICEIAAMFYETAIRRKLKTPNLASTQFGRDLITTVRLHDAQVERKEELAIPRDDEGYSITLQAWLAIFTNYSPEWWLGTFQEIALEATSEFQKWAGENLELELKDFCKIDERGRVYKTIDITSNKNRHRYDEYNPLTKEKIECPVRGWQYNKHELRQKIIDGEVQYVGNSIEGRVFLKDYFIDKAN